MKTNVLRALFLSLSRMPPAMMLLIIIGLAVIVTEMVTGRVAQQQKSMLAGRQTSAYASNSEFASPIVISNSPIPANTKIAKDMIEQVRAEEQDIWQDALSTIPNAVGRTTKKAIPAHAQIRESDLN